MTMRRLAKVCIMMIALLLCHGQVSQSFQLKPASPKKYISAPPSGTTLNNQSPAANETMKETPNFSQHRENRVPPLGLGKLGAWIQPNSVDTSLAYQFCQWFIADWRVVKKVVQKADGRPVLMAFGSRDIDEIDNAVRDNLKSIRGVVLDYETGENREKAEKELISIYRRLHGMGLIVGISTLAKPASSLKSNGVDFSKARLYCDFLLPQLYSRIWKNDPSQTTARYLEELRESSVPVVPVITYATTKNNPGKVTPSDVLRNYGPLNLPCLVVWNVAESDLKFWETLRSL
jgi:hypothetical protein